MVYIPRLSNLIEKCSVIAGYVLCNFLPMAFTIPQHQVEIESNGSQLFVPFRIVLSFPLKVFQHLFNRRVTHSGSQIWNNAMALVKFSEG